jgi:hypothetical protein
MEKPTPGEPVNQIARARNTGAAAATGDWLLFIDLISPWETLSMLARAVDDRWAFAAQSQNHAPLV